MKEWGWTLTLAGAAVVLGALTLMSTTAAVDVPGLYGSSTRDVHNLGLLQNRQLVFEGGCFLFLGGIVLLGFSALSERMAMPIAAAPIESEPSPAPIAPVEAPSQSAPSVDREAGQYQLLATSPPSRSDWAELRLFLVGGGLVLAAIAFFAFASINSKSDDSSYDVTTTNNAEALADEMERLADQAENSLAGR